MTDEQTTENSDGSTHTEATEEKGMETKAESTQEGPSNQEAAEGSPERPEWLDKKFETPEQLQNSYNQLQQKFHSRRDEIKQELIQELNSEAEKDIPISPADYKLNIQAPEGMEVEVNENDPMVTWFRDKAHNYGLKQEEFDSLINEYNMVLSNSGPDWNQESVDLGEHADRRLERVDTWAKSHLSDEAYKTFASIPASSSMVKTFEEVMELNGQPKFNMISTTEFQEDVTQDDLKSAMADEKYWKNGGDPSHLAKVRQMSARLVRQKERAS